ncbi:hypothetical protein BDZ97DRAFT_1880427 [Flammula alnicola]|nr:hypothetical protein BDZ97DRAFT_1880427 [Flammula alnicola]
MSSTDSLQTLLAQLFAAINTARSGNYSSLVTLTILAYDTVLTLEKEGLGQGRCLLWYAAVMPLIGDGRARDVTDPTTRIWPLPAHLAFARGFSPFEAPGNPRSRRGIRVRWSRSPTFRGFYRFGRRACARAAPCPRRLPSRRAPAIPSLA